MTDQHIPHRLDPFKQIGASLSYDGLIELNKLSRLEDLLADREGSVRVTLGFKRDEQKIAVVTGTVSADLNLICQRCHQPGNYEVNSVFNFALIRDEEDSENLPEVYEPMVLENPELDVYEMIEEELILALPIVFYHEKGLKDSCDSFYQKVSFGKLEGDLEEQTKPFAVLEKLIKH